jgi:hypothetical protein
MRACCLRSVPVRLVVEAEHLSQNNCCGVLTVCSRLFMHMPDLHETEHHHLRLRRAPGL